MSSYQNAALVQQINDSISATITNIVSNGFNMSQLPTIVQTVVEAVVAVSSSQTQEQQQQLCMLVLQVIVSDLVNKNIITPSIGLDINTAVNTLGPTMYQLIVSCASGQLNVQAQAVIQDVQSGCGCLSSGSKNPSSNTNARNLKSAPGLKTKK